jgi:hypothetical protein
MQRVIEFIILVACIAAACGIVSWLVVRGNKANKSKRNNESDWH